MESATQWRVRPLMLEDTPLVDVEGDFFRYAAYAEAVAKLIGGESIKTPLTIAISGAWGAGKTSLARMIEDHLRTQARSDNRQNLFCWFDAWMHHDAPHLGVALAARVATEANRNRPWWRRYLLEPLPAAMLSSRERWRRRVGLAVSALLVAVTALAVDPIRSAVESVPLMRYDGASTGSVAALLILLALLTSRLFSALERTAHFIDDPASAAAHGSIAEVRDQLGRLIEQALYDRRLVVFVDNLERCSPERAMEVCEVANQLLSHPNVVTVLIADMHLIAKAAEARFTDASPGGNAGRRYLEKLVQLQITLPPPKSEALERLLGDAGPARDGQSDGARGDPDLDERESRHSLLDVPSDVPFLIAEYPRIGLPAFILGAGAGYWIAASLGAFHPSASTIVVGLAFAFEGAALTCMVVAALHRRYRPRRRLARREAINSRIREAIVNCTGHGVSKDELVKALEVTPRDQEMAEELVENYLIAHSVELHEVEGFIMRFAPPLPRSAKRMLNHARLLTSIAFARRLFDGDPRLSPTDLGAWIALSELWPGVARKVERDPQLLERLQKLAENREKQKLAEIREKFSGAVGEWDEADITALCGLLVAAPGLGAAAVRLVHFE